MTLSTSTVTLAPGSSRTYSLAPGEAVTVATEPNCYVTVTETPDVISSADLDGQTNVRTSILQYKGSWTYGPYALGGTVAVAVSLSKSTSSVSVTLGSAAAAVVRAAGYIPTPVADSGARALNVGRLMADADRMLVTRGVPTTTWANPTFANGATRVSMSQAGMFDTSLHYGVALVGSSGSRSYAVQAARNAPIDSTAIRGVLVQVKTPLRPGVSHIPFRVKLAAGNTDTKWLGATFLAPADGQEHWIAIPAGYFAAIGGFIAGTDTITHIRIEDRNDSANLGYAGLQTGETAYVGAVYLNPKGRSKAIIRFDDSMTELANATATFSGDGTTQAWSCLSLLRRYGMRGTTWNITKRIGTSNAGKTFATWAELRSLQSEGWDICLQTHNDPVDSANNGARLLGPFGYTARSIASVDTAANTITASANHLISNPGAYWGYPVVFSGPDLPAPLVAGTTYWARYSSATAMTLHPTENDSIGNTNVIDLTTSGTAASMSYRYANSTPDSSGILADYNTGRDLLIANGINPVTASMVALNQGAWDAYVVEALTAGGYGFVWGIEGGGGGSSSQSRIAVGEAACPNTRGSTCASSWLTLPSAIQTDGGVSPNAATIRAYVQEQVRVGAIFGNYHHALTAGNGVQLDAYLDELRIQQAAGALDICTASEVRDYLNEFAPLPQMPAGATPV